MKQRFTPVVSALVLGFSAVLASAQMAQQTIGGEQRSTAFVHPSPMSENALGRKPAEELLGRTVVNANGETVGEIEDIVVSSDRAVYAIVSSSGFLGLGERQVAIPFDQLWTGHEDEAILMMSKRSAGELETWSAHENQNYISIPRDKPVPPR